MSAPAAENGQVAYRLRQVVKHRAKGGSVFELHVPGLDIRQGEFVAIVGASGCGKSTLLDMLGLVLVPTSCEAFSLTVNGETHDLMNQSETGLARLRRAHLGYVLQTGGLLPFLSVADNIMLPCRLNSRQDADEHVEQLLKRLKIHGQANKKPQHLSGGQRQRAAIARALAHRPPVVLADEPTAAVDKYNALSIRDQFKELTSTMGITLVMVTHDEALVSQVADRTFSFKIQHIDENHTASTVMEVP